MTSGRQVFRFGVFELDAAAGELRKEGRRVRLQPQPAKLLHALLARPGEVVTRDEIRQLLWGAETFVDFDPSLNFAIKQVRMALGDDADAPRFIETIPRRGYRFVGAVLADPAPPAHVSSPPAHVSPPAQPVRSLPFTRRDLALGLLLIAALVIGAAFALHARPGAPIAGAEPVIRFEIVPPAGEELPADSLPAISPDGTTVAFASGPAGHSLLYLRKLSDATVHPLAGTERAAFPFWSPDGTRLAFFANGVLKIVEPDGGRVVSVWPVSDPRGGSWNATGTIVAGQRHGPLLAIPAGGGPARPATPFDESADVNFAWPSFLPDGRHYLVTYRSLRRDRTGIYVGDLETGMLRFIVPYWGNAAFAGGFLFYPREPPRQHVPLFSAWRTIMVDRAALVAQRFDPDRQSIVGEPVTVSDDVRYWSLRGLAVFATSGSGVLALRTADLRPRTRLKWFDRRGRETADFGEDTFYPHPEISPDGSRVAFQRVDPEAGNADIWIADLVRGLKTRLTFDQAIDSLPVWSPDGGRIAFASDRAGPSDIYIKEIGGGDPERRIGTSRFVMFPTGWSPDGRTILFQHHKGRINSLDALQVGSTGAAAAVLAEDGANDASAQFSPDGRWIAYASGHGDRVPLLGPADAPQIVVEDYPGRRGTWQLTSTNGWEPRWRGDGRELFYLQISPGGEAAMMAVPVEERGSGVTFGRARQLFTVPVWMGPPTPRNHFAVSADGERFLIDVVVARPRPQLVTVVTSWRALLRRQLPVP